MNLKKSQTLMAAGNCEQAIAMLPPAGASPDPRVEIIRARIQMANTTVPDAIQTLDVLTKQFPENAPGHLFTGIALWDSGQPDAAKMSFSEALALQKNNDLAKSYIALCLFALGDRMAAADMWRLNGFCDNSMFRVRVAEFTEHEWLHDQSLFSEVHGIEPVKSKRVSQRKALRQFYRRDFRSMLNYLPLPPCENELQAFLAATAHEMLFQHSAAHEYIAPFLSRRSEWPDALVALNARLMIRRGEIAAAAEELAGIVLMGPEDFGVNYYMGIVCLAFDMPVQARQYFLRAFTTYMVDTLEFQWWQIEQVLLHPQPELKAASPSLPPD